MQDCWSNSNGDVATDLWLGGVMKRVMDSFIAKTNVVVNSPDIRGIVKTVTSYETSFGTLFVHRHRYIQQSGDSTARILATRAEKLKVAFLEKPTVLTDLATAGAYTPRAVYGSLTVEVRNQDSNFFADGFLNSF